jgi:putative ABC transport system substrate-binding protein
MEISMSKKIFYLASGVLLFALCLPAQAQQPKKVLRIGYVSNADPATESARAEAIRQRLREHGYIESQNIAIEFRYGEGKRERAPKVAAELVALNCDVIVVFGGYTWIRAVMDATKRIPIVMTGGGLDPVDSGLVKSLAHPGGNVTGITNLGIQLSGKHLELLKEAVPKLTRVAVLYESANPGNVRVVKEDLPPAARALKLTVRSWGVGGDANSFERVFGALNKERPDGLYVVGGGGLIGANGKRIASLAVKSRLPSMFARSAEVEAGGLMSYGADQADSYRQVAWYIDKILKGAKPEDLPVQQPMKFEFVINKKTADQIGLTIPQWTLMKADKVIK